jgi:predicted permease
MMRWFYKLPLRLRSLFRKARLEKELADELHFHLEKLIEGKAARGMTPEEARYSALCELGGVEQIKEECRDMRRVNYTENFMQDVRYGLRQLRHNPGFTAVAIVTLGLGIGANTAIFSLINAVMLRPLPVRDPQQLVVLKWSARQWPKLNGGDSWSGCPIKATGLKEPAPEGCSFSYPMFEQVRGQNNIFSAVFALVPSPQFGVSIDGHAGFANGEYVSGEFFRALGLRASAGRLLGPPDDSANAPLAVVLSHSYWERQFGGAPSVIGKVITINNVPFTVIGVGPPEFFGLDLGIAQDLWLPLSTQPRLVRYFRKTEDPASWWLMIGARLKPGVEDAQAQAATEVVFRRGVTSGPSPLLKPEDAPHIELPHIGRGLATLRKNFGDPLFLLMAAVALVLLIACANVASLMLARTAARQKEFAVRSALGAEFSRIFRQLLTESLMLAAAGGLLGVVLAWLGSRSLAGFLAANWFASLAVDVHPDLRVLAFTVAIAALTGIIFGLAPAARSARSAVAPALKGSAPLLSAEVNKGWNPRRSGLGNALVVTQVALSILVLMGASLLVRTLIVLATMNVGFDAHNLIIFSVEPELNGYQGERLAGLFPELQRRLGVLPGVSSVGYSAGPLLAGGYSARDVYFPGQSGEQADVLDVGPHFFETMRIPLVSGRTYDAQDFNSASTKKMKVAIVNQSFVRRFYKGRNAVGQLICLDDKKPPDVEIVGVVGDTKYNELRQGIEPTMYFPMQPGGGTFEVRTALDPKILIPSIRAAVRSLDSNLPLARLMTQSEQIDQDMFQERLVAWLSGAFALLALVVACIGLYGLLAFEVTQRRHEVGVRMALGASPRQVLGLVLGRGVRLVAVGAVLGIAASLGLTPYLQSLLYGVRPIDPLAFAAVTVLLLIVTMGACYVPARRATKVDPLVALRYE